MVMLFNKSAIMLPLENCMVARILRSEDISQNYIDALNNPSLNQNMATHSASKEALKGYVEDNFFSEDTLLFGLFDGDGILLGTSRIHDFRTYKPWMGILIFDEKRRGQGLGSTLVRAVSNYALEKCMAKIVYAGIYKKNVASIKCFKKSGFYFYKIDEAHSGPEREIWSKGHVS